MRIDAYNQISQIYKTSDVNKSKKTDKISETSDKFEISGIAKDIQNVKQAISDVPDIREDKVQDVKAALENGTYEVDMDDFASILMSKIEENM